MSHEGNRDITIKDNFLNHILKLSYHLTSQIANATDITESKPVFPVTSSTFEIKILFHALEIHFILLKTKRCILKAGQKFLRLKRLQKEGEQKSRIPIDRHTPKSRQSKPRWWGPSLCRPAVVHKVGGCQRQRRPFVGHVSFWRVQKLLVIISFTWIFLLIDTGRPGQTDKDTQDSEKKTNTLPDNIQFAYIHSRSRCYDLNFIIFHTYHWLQAQFRTGTCPKKRESRMPRVQQGTREECWKVTCESSNTGEVGIR